MVQGGFLIFFQLFKLERSHLSGGNLQLRFRGFGSMCFSFNEVVIRMWADVA